MIRTITLQEKVNSTHQLFTKNISMCSISVKKLIAEAGTDGFR